MLYPDFTKLLNQTGIKFQDNNLLELAFTHRSYLNEVKESIESNERLEFLGDAVLSFIVSSYLFNKRTQDNEGDLTNLRSYIVKTRSLAEAAQKLELGQYLRLSKGEEMYGGRNNPQLLANTYEALLGAVFLDQGFETAQTFVYQTLLPFFEKEIKDGPPKDAKSQLQEIVQTQTKEAPLYKVLETAGPDHAKEFVVGVFINGEEVGKGKGASKQIAEEEAATEALDKLK